MEIELLPAEYGDAIVIRTKADGNPFTIVIDGGPRGTVKKVSKYYEELGHIDLMILTHFDEDHIAGILEYAKLFSDKSMPVDRFWCNCAQNIDFNTTTDVSDTGFENANTLASYLRKQKLLNPAFEWREEIKTGMRFEKGNLKIAIISPSQEILTTLKSDYNDYILRHPQIDEENESTDIASFRVDLDAKKTIDDLAEKDTPRNVNLWNKASIAFLLSAEGKQILMTGDADADVMAAGIEALPDLILPLHLDLTKVSHHGSKNNISYRLLSHIRCQRFAFTTNGGTRNWYHPDRKTLAIILKGANRAASEQVDFYFNYPVNSIQKRTGVLLSEEEQKRHNCKFLEKYSIEL